ncbi:MAG: replicative DNA helicase [Lentimicrobiaceae bacterium]|nr:replicative DNA helicase [Lentimicrobiaceae bacterium]
MTKEIVKKERKRVIIPEVDIQGRVQPQAIDFEEALLGSMMLEQNAVGLVIEKLKPDMFYKEAHKIIFKAIQSVFNNNSTPVDLLSVREQLRKTKDLETVGGSYYLVSLTNKVVSSANIEYYARIVSEKFISRELISVSTTTIRDAYDESTDVLKLLDDTETNIYSITEQNFQRSYVDMSTLIQDFIKELNEVKSSKGELRGVPSGFTKLDRITGGWQKSNLIVLAARPGMGKTAFVLSMARNMAVEQKRPVAVFSLEMSRADLVMRLISAETGIPSDQLRRADLSDSEWDKLGNDITSLTDAPIIIDDTPGLTIFELRAKCRRLKQQHGIECIIIDYLQLMIGDKESKGNREQEISNISRSLKSLAKDLNVPVIALSQLNRSVESRSVTSKRPQLSDLRESGAIEQDADMVLFIYRPEYYKIDEFEDHEQSAGLAEIIIAKHRNGGIGDVRLRFIAHQAKFCEREPQPQYIKIESIINAMGADNPQETNSGYTLPQDVPF